MENPITAFGGALAKGGVSETIKQLKDFLDDYPVFEGIAKGKKIVIRQSSTIEIQAVVEE